MKPNGNASTLSVCRHKNIHFQKALSNGTLVPKLLHIFGWSLTVPMECWLFLMLRTSKTLKQICMSVNSASQGCSCQNLMRGVSLFRLELRSYTRSIWMEMACHELLKQDCYTGAGTTDSFSHTYLYWTGTSLTTYCTCVIFCSFCIHVLASCIHVLSFYLHVFPFWWSKV